MMILKEIYKRPIKIDGVLYDFSNYSREKLQMIFDANPKLRYLFEEEETIKELEDLGISGNKEFEAIIEEVIKKPKRKRK